MKSLIFSALVAAVSSSAFALAPDCEPLLAGQTKAQKAIAALIEAVDRSSSLNGQAGVANRLRYAFARGREVYRAFTIGLSSARMTRPERARLCKLTERVMNDTTSITTHGAALLELSTALCENANGKILPVFGQALKTAGLLGHEAVDALEMAKELLAHGHSFEEAVSGVALPRTQWNALAPLLDPLNYVIYRLRLNRVDETIAPDLEKRIAGAAARRAEIDWSSEGAERLIGRLLYQRLDGNYVPLVTLKSIFAVLQANSVEHFEGRPLEIKIKKIMTSVQRARAELFFGETTAVKEIWKQERVKAQAVRAVLEKVPVTSVRDLIRAFTLTTLGENPEKIKRGDQTRQAIHLKALAEVYFPALRHRMLELPNLRPTLAEVRALLELWTQFPEVADHKGFDVIEEILGLQLSLSTWATHSVGDDLRDVMRIVDFKSPNTPNGERMKKVAMRLAFDRVVSRGDGSLRWLDLPDREDDPPPVFDPKLGNSRLRLLHDLRGSVPAPERSEAAIYAKAVEMLVATEDPSKVTDPSLRRRIEDMTGRFGTDRLREGLFAFLQARSESPNKAADIVVTNEQMPTLIDLAGLYGYSESVLDDDGGLPRHKFTFAVKVD